MLKRITALIFVLLLLTGCAGEGNGQKEPVVSDPAHSAIGSYPGLGGVMPEMTFTTSAGETMKLSALLAEKKLVVLNFWFANCGWCMKEFPVMELAYQRYQNDVEIVALNPVDGAEAVNAFVKNNSLSFPMAACPRSWAVEMGITAYPTSVFIDRDGVVCLVHRGAITTADTFYELFELFTSDDYQQQVYNSLDEVFR